MINPCTVGAMRQQAAFKDSACRVVIVSSDHTISKLCLRVVKTYPDTTNQHGQQVPGGTFKIEVEALP